MNDHDANHETRESPDGAAEHVPVEPLDPLMVADVLEALALRQEALERAFDVLTRRLGATPKDGPWAWRTLGPGRRRELLTQLRDWVDWLVTRYELRGEAQTIPPCWHRHPVAVEELTALMVAWHAAYSADAAAPSDALITWHDRWLWPTLHRLNIALRVWTKCTGGAHDGARPAPPLTDSDDFTALLEHLTAGSTPAPGAQHLSPDDVHRLLTSGDGEALLLDDPHSPIRFHGRWYGILDADGTDDWTLLDDERGAHLDAMHTRLLESLVTGVSS